MVKKGLFVLTIILLLVLAVACSNGNSQDNTGTLPNTTTDSYSLP